MNEVFNPFAPTSVGAVSFLDVERPMPVRLETSGRHVRRVYELAELKRVFPAAVLASAGKGSSLQYRLFVQDRVGPDESLFWGCFFVGSYLERGGRLGRVSVAFGLLVADGWESIG